MEVSLQQWQNATKDCMDTIENFSKIHQPPPNIPDQVDTALPKAIKENAAFLQVQAVANTASTAVRSLKETVDELKANSVLSAPSVFKLTVNQMMALPAAADLHKLMQWLSKTEAPEGTDPWLSWWDAKVTAQQTKKTFATSTLLVHRTMAFVNRWHADPAALSLEDFTLELTTMSALLEMLGLPHNPEQRFQKLLQKIFKQAPLSVRQILAEWNSLWDEDSVVHLNAAVFGPEELNTVVDNRVVGWQPQKFTTPKLTPKKYPEDFREVFDRCGPTNDNATVWKDLQEEEGPVSNGGVTDGEASIEDEMNDSRATESEESDSGSATPEPVPPPAPKKSKKAPKYSVDVDFLPAKPTLFQRPQTYQDIVDAQMNSWAAKQAAKRK